MAKHAEPSPSGFHRIIGPTGCRASLQQSDGKPNPSSTASRQGSAEHLVASSALETGKDASAYLGQTVVFYAEVDDPSNEHECFSHLINVEAVIAMGTVVIDDDAVARVQAYLDYVRNLADTLGGTSHVEVKVPIDHLNGQPDATGTSDFVQVSTNHVAIVDYKGGSSKVTAYTPVGEPEADIFTGELLPPKMEPNPQLAAYASGAIRKFAPDAKTVTLVIVQPKINHVSEFTLSVDELNAFNERVRQDIAEAREPNPVFSPSDDNCFFCAGRHDCEARTSTVLVNTVSDFDDLDVATTAPVKDDALGDMYALVPLVRRWCDDIEDATMAALDNGKRVVRSDGLTYKLVDGKQGNRKWADEAAVRELVEATRLHKVMLVEQLISPTEAEKLAAVRKRRKAELDDPKPAIGPVNWTRLQQLITRTPPKAEIALETDPRPTRHQVEFDIEVPQPVAAVSADNDLFA